MGNEAVAAAPANSAGAAAPVSNMTTGSPASGAAQAKPEGQPAAGEAQAKREIPEWLRKVKVNGREVEVTDPDELIKRAQDGWASQEKYSESAKMRREAIAAKREAELLKQEAADAKQKHENYIDRLAEQLEKAETPEKYWETRNKLEKILAKEIRNEIARQDPNQARIMDLEKKLALKEAGEQETAQTAEQQAFAKEEAEWLETYQQTIIKALQAGKVANSPRAARAMAFYLEQAADAKVDVAPEELANFVRDDIIEDNKGIAGDLSKRAAEAYQKEDWNQVIDLGEQLTQLFGGEEIISAIRRYDLAKLKAGRTAVPEPVLETRRAKEAPQNKKPYMSMDEYESWRKENIRRIDAGLPPQP